MIEMIWQRVTRGSKVDVNKKPREQQIVSIISILKLFALLLLSPYARSNNHGRLPYSVPLRTEACNKSKSIVTYLALMSDKLLLG
jgi:hypothetical protein